MRRILNVIIILGFMITKVQGVEAQESLISTKTKEIKNKNFDNKIINPSSIASIIEIDPYEYSKQKEADTILLSYREKVEIEKKKAEEEQRRINEQKNSITVLPKIDKRSDFTLVYQSAALRFGIDWRLLKAIHLIESGGSGNTSKMSYAGARGPMQFMPLTFKAYAIDGDGDGKINIDDVDDAIYTAAHYLAKNGAATNVRNAIFRYNRSLAYVENVLSLARSLGFSK